MKIDHNNIIIQSQCFLLLTRALILVYGLGLGWCTEVYYILPANDPPNCPGEPCLPLDGYMMSIDKYFGSDKVNITMKFVPGIHTTNQKDTVISGLRKS